MSYFFKYTLQIKHVEAWFKWLSWVALSAIIASAWNESKSIIVLPMMLLSFIYVWCSAFHGVTEYFVGYFHPKKLSPYIAWLLAGLVVVATTYYMLLALPLLYMGLFKCS